MKLDISQPIILLEEIVRKLDNNFYAGRWGRIPERQRDLMRIIALLPSAEDEFSVQEIVEKSTELHDTFKASAVNQLLSKLAENELIYKNRHGKYSFAVPMFSGFINRQ